jgi:hypothetical protein
MPPAGYLRHATNPVCPLEYVRPKNHLALVARCRRRSRRFGPENSDKHGKSTSPLLPATCGRLIARTSCSPSGSIAADWPKGLAIGFFGKAPYSSACSTLTPDGTPNISQEHAETPKVIAAINPTSLTHIARLMFDVMALNFQTVCYNKNVIFISPPASDGTYRSDHRRFCLKALWPGSFRQDPASNESVYWTHS